MTQASPCCLTILSVKALVPDSNNGNIMGEVTKRRGRVLGMHPGEDSLQQSKPSAESEMSALPIHPFFYSGRGSFTTEFLRYEPLPQTSSRRFRGSGETQGRKPVII